MSAQQTTRTSTSPKTPSAGDGLASALAEYAQHSPFSDPGRHAALVAAVATDPVSLHEAVTRTIVHYRGEADVVTPEQLADVDNRWVARILDRATRRSPGPLSAVREPSSRVGGCCRDHSLLSVSILREHGIPARTRLGFADYFEPGVRHDHVVVERWEDGRWVRSDPELGPEDFSFDVHDMPTGEGSPFETSAEAWLAFRAGRTDLSSYGVGPAAGRELNGPAFVQRYVLGDLAHRRRCELLLWDGWGAMTPPGEELDGERVELTDEVARLTVEADAGDARAHAAIRDMWASDERVRPGAGVLTFSPVAEAGVPPTWTALELEV
jgi:hypothetical protein